MPTSTTERTKSLLVEPVLDPQDNKLVGFRARTFVIRESVESWERTRDFLADRALAEHVSGMTFAGKLRSGIFESGAKMRMRKLMDDQAKGKTVKAGTEGTPENTAVSAMTNVKYNYANELRALAESKNIEYKDKAVLAKGKKRFLEGVSGGDRLQVVGDANLTAKVNEVVRKYASGEMSDEELLEMSSNLINAVAAKDKKTFGKVSAVTDLPVIAREAKAIYQNHQGRIDLVDENLIDVIAGSANGGLQTKRKRDLLDRVMNLADRSPIPINSLTVGVGFAAGASALRTGATKVPIIGGFAGAAFGALKRYSKEKSDWTTKQQEAELGYDIQSPAKAKGILNKVASGLLGRTDFSEIKYDLVDASAVVSDLHNYIDHGDSAGFGGSTIAAIRRNMVQKVAEVDAMLDFTKHTDRATFKFGDELNGLANINRKKLALIAAVAMVKTKLREVMTNEEIKEIYGEEYMRNIHDLKAETKNVKWKFKWNRLSMAGRSGAVGFGLGFVSGGGISEIVEVAGLDGVLDKIHETVFAFPISREIQSAVAEVKHTVRHFAGEVIPGFRHDNIHNVPLSANEHMGTSKDSEFFYAVGPNGRLQIPISESLDVEKVKETLHVVGLDGKVNPTSKVVEIAPHSVQSEILSDSYLKGHNMVDIHGHDYDLGFGHGKELSLHQSSSMEWSVPDSGNDQVAFFQVKSPDGVHTMISPIQNGKISLPEESVNPVSGKVDAFSAVGYGVFHDKDGHILTADKIISNPDVINRGSLTSVASVSLNQTERMVGGQTMTIRDIDVSNLTRVEHFESVSDLSLPAFPVFWTPRVFAEAGKSTGEVTDRAWWEEPNILLHTLESEYLIPDELKEQIDEYVKSIDEGAKKWADENYLAVDFSIFGGSPFGLKDRFTPAEVSDGLRNFMIAESIKDSDSSEHEAILREYDLLSKLSYVRSNMLDAVDQYFQEKVGFSVANLINMTPEAIAKDLLYVPPTEREKSPEQRKSWAIDDVRAYDARWVAGVVNWDYENPDPYAKKAVALRGMVYGSEISPIGSFGQLKDLVEVLSYAGLGSEDDLVIEARQNLIDAINITFRRVLEDHDREEADRERRRITDDIANNNSGKSDEGTNLPVSTFSEPSNESVVQITERPLAEWIPEIARKTTRRDERERIKKELGAIAFRTTSVQGATFTKEEAIEIFKRQGADLKVRTSGSKKGKRIPLPKVASFASNVPNGTRSVVNGAKGLFNRSRSVAQNVVGFAGFPFTKKSTKDDDEDYQLAVSAGDDIQEHLRRQQELDSRLGPDYVNGVEGRRKKLTGE